MSNSEDASPSTDPPRLLRVRQSQAGHVVNDNLLLLQDVDDSIVKQRQPDKDVDLPQQKLSPSSSAPSTIHQSTSMSPTSTSTKPIDEHQVTTHAALGESQITTESTRGHSRPGAYRVRGIESSDNDNSLTFDTVESAEFPVGGSETDMNDNSWVGVEEAITMVMATKRAEEVQQKDDKKTRFSRRKYLWIALIGMLLLVGIVVGVVVALQQRSNNSTPSSSSSSKPAIDTTSTTIAITGTMAPSSVPSTSSRPNTDKESRLASRTRTIAYYFASSTTWKGVTLVLVESHLVLEINEGRLLNETNETIPYSPTRNDLLTVFGISDTDLLNAMSIDLIQKFIKPVWRGHTINIIRNQMLPFELQWRDVTEGMVVTTVAGHNITLSRERESINNDTSLLENKDEYLASNGVIHRLFTPLWPPWMGKTLYDLLERDPDLSIFASLVSQTGLEILLSHDQAGPVTVFAPVNSAFEGDNLLSVLMETDPEALTTILEYHFYYTNVYVKNRDYLPLEDGLDSDHDDDLMALGAHLVIDFSSGERNGATINGAAFLEADILAENGVLHKIDRVLGLGGS